MRWLPAWIAIGMAMLAGSAIPASAQRGLRPTHAARNVPVLMVGNYRDGTVTVIDQRTFRVLGTIDVIPDGKTPQDPAQAAVYPGLVAAKGVDYVQGLALSPDGRTLYVSRGYLGDVAAFDVASRRMLWRLEVSGVRADHLALSPDGSRLFVSALTANEVQVIDTRTHQFIGSFPTGDWAHVLEYTPDRKFIVNGSLGNQLLPSGAPNHFWMTFADPRTLRVEPVLKFDAGVRPFTFSPDGRLAYVQFSYFNGFKVVSTSTGAIVHTVNLPVRGPAVGEAPSQYPNQAAHHGITLSGDGASICDAATVSNYVALVARGSLRSEAIIPVGDQPAEAETSRDGRLCFVSNRGPGPGGDTVSVISFARRREIARIHAGDGPMEMSAGLIPLAWLSPPAPCPGATGRLRGRHLGLIWLGMTRAHAERAYPSSSDRGERYEEFFCLTPTGIRVGYASPKLLRTLAPSERRGVRDRVVWASTDNGFYSLRGVRPGMRLSVAAARLHLGRGFRVGLNWWYFAPQGIATGLLKVRHRVIEEIGIADARLTHGRHAQRAFIESFS